jgi:hypothetical protein
MWFLLSFVSEQGQISTRYCPNKAGKGFYVGWFPGFSRFALTNYLLLLELFQTISRPF